jgi:hypothetical protein
MLFPLVGILSENFEQLRVFSRGMPPFYGKVNENMKSGFFIELTSEHFWFLLVWEIAVAFG